jgi:protein-L-isoaspartate(D-aspartate) O-methyltransferase
VSRRLPDAEEFASQRADMVEQQLRRRGIRDQRVLEAMASIPRERFVPEPYARRTYADSALPIGHDQTISQPWIAAAICQAMGLSGSEVVLEVGTGSGYSAAVIAALAGAVITIERVPELAERARATLLDLGIVNVEVVVGDGSAGVSDRAPFDAIAVHATAPEPPPTLLGQLAVGGRLVVPIASRRADMLTVFRRLGETVDVTTGEGLERDVIGPCRFVPLIGSEGFSE